MKRLLAAGLLAMVLTCAAGPAVAVPDDYDDSQSHPLQVAAYLINTIGYTLEWLVFRPFPYVVSLPYLAQSFGRRPHRAANAYCQCPGRLLRAPRFRRCAD